MHIYYNSQLLGMKKHYQDKNWLLNKYEVEKISTYEIAKICEVDAECIRGWLKRFDIKRREAYKSNFSKYRDELEEFIIGSMLGDGSLIWGSNDVSVYFSISSKYKEYLEHIESQLKPLGILRRGELKQYTGGLGKFYLLQSKYYRGYLAEQRKLWYPNGKKTLPKKIKLTSNILRTLYIDDGSLIVNRNRKRVSSVAIFLNDFALDEVKCIRGLISDIIGVTIGDLKINPNKPDQYGILIHRRTAIIKFFECIGDCPECIKECFGYKWPIIENGVIDYNWRN